MAVTQHDIAARAGVTRTTVGYVLSGRRQGGRISEAVAERVRAVARELGYVPDRRAQALVSGRTRVVALLFTSGGEDDWVWNRIAQGAQRTIAAAGYDTLIQAIDPARPIGDQAQAILAEQRADAVIALPYATVAATQARPELPLVWIDLGRPVPEPCVGHDVRPGLAQAVRHLADFGHRDVWWISPEVPDPRPALDRTAAVVAAAAEAGIALHAVPLPLGWQALTSYLVNQQAAALDVIARVLAQAPPATAALCWNDALALAVGAILRDRGLRVPDDVSVVGFDDVRPLFTVPQLSTVSGAFSDMGAAAARLALDLAVAEPPSSPRSLAVPSTFIPRRSSGPRSSSPRSGAHTSTP